MLFLKFPLSNNRIFAQQDLKCHPQKYFSLFVNEVSRNKSKSFITRLINSKKSFILANTLVNVRETAPITNILCNSFDNFMTYTLSSLSIKKEHNIDFKYQKTDKNTNFFGTELNKAFQNSSKKASSYNFLKQCDVICKNGNKTNQMILLNKNICCYGNFFCHNLYSFKSYSKNLEELEKKQTKEVFEKHSEETKPSSSEKKLTSKQKLKATVRDYGVIVIVFHVTISLISLGICYLIVLSGYHYSQNVETVENVGTVETAATFVVAYAIHKALAPARIAITLSVAPFIVKKLRKNGILKPPKS